MNTYNIYALIDPRTGDPFYVGVTVKSIEKRLSQHIKTINRTAKIGAMARRAQFIKEMVSGGLIPEIKLLAETSIDKVDHLERQYFNKLIKSGKFQGKNAFVYTQTCKPGEPRARKAIVGRNKRKQISATVSKTTISWIMQIADQKRVSMAKMIEELLIEAMANRKSKRRAIAL